LEDVEYTYVTSDGERGEILKWLEASEVIGIDLETVGTTPEPGKLRLVQVSDGEATYVIDAFEVDPTPVLEAIQDKTVAAHNAEYESSWIKTVYGIDLELVDTMLLSRVTRAGEKETRYKKDGTPYEADLSHSLEAVAKRELGLELDKEMQTSDWSAETLIPRQLSYAAADAQVLVEIYKRLGDLGGGEDE
jgi:ribonuclease D